MCTQLLTTPVGHGKDLEARGVAGRVCAQTTLAKATETEIRETVGNILLIKLGVERGSGEGEGREKGKKK